MPLISVIVPVYNVVNVLNYCIDSILSQTFRDFELILIDDGSQDNSGKICDEYALIDNRVSVVHKINEGVSIARNTGINLAKGKYICFVDSDDILGREYIEKLVRFKENYTDIDNIWCGFKTIDNYECYDSSCHYVFEENNSFSMTNRKNIMTLHEKWLDAGPYCKIFDRDKIINNHIFFPEDLSLGEDLIFNFKYLDKTNGKIIIINQTDYYYFINNNNSLGRKYYSNLFDIYKKINSVMEYYIIKWKCDNNQITKYYNFCFFKYENVLKNTFNIENNMSKKDKYKYNDYLLKSKEIQTAYKNCNVKILFLYRFAYRLKCFRLYTIADNICDMFVHFLNWK